MDPHQLLRTPGPTPLPERVVRSASRPMINPRGPEFGSLLHDCTKGVQWALGTSHDVLLFAGTGSAGLEAAVANLLSPGERALFCTSGWFGEVWARIARSFGVDVVQLEAAWGEPVDPELVDGILDLHPDVEKVFVTHNETSTGVTNDLCAIAEVVKSRGHLLAVDGVSSAGCQPLPVDELGVDLVVTASQKGWLSPPGLCMIALSPDAFAASARASCPRWYFDILLQRASHERGFMHTTPPLSVMYALQEGIAIMREEGMERIWRRHRRVAEMIRSGLAALGLTTVGRGSHASSTVTAVHSPMPSPHQLAVLLTDLRDRHGLVLADGYGQLQGRSFRIGHLGAVGDADAYTLLALLEQGLADHGVVDDVGRAVAAAQSVVRSGGRPHRPDLTPGDTWRRWSSAPRKPSLRSA